MKGFAFHEIGGIMIFITFFIFFDLFVCYVSTVLQFLQYTCLLDYHRIVL